MIDSYYIELFKQWCKLNFYSNIEDDYIRYELAEKGFNIEVNVNNNEITYILSDELGINKYEIRFLNLFEV